MSAGIPRKIGAYRVRRPLGSGSFADTYLVAADDGQYALKWLRPDAEKGGVQRIANEISALQQLDHIRIPKFRDQGTHKGRPFLVMEYAHGKDLRTTYSDLSREGSHLSVQKVIAIMEALLDALAEVHCHKIIHRDVKDANVIVNLSASDVHLVDFGFCKGFEPPESADTFWNAGAARYSPPDKLRHPGRDDPTDDVFAVGVLAYQMLTGSFPWDTTGDRGDLEELMRTETPAPIRQLNPQVPGSVEDLITALLGISLRPTAYDALAHLNKIRDELQPTSFARPASHSYPMRRVLRDPLRGDILLTEFEWQLLGTREFQRLRWLRQLGTAHLVFPGATHSRFSHAVGAMYTAATILRRIEERTGVLFKDEEKLTARCYALAHDVTHVAYGHTLEDELALFDSHDANTARKQRLVMGEGSEIGELMRSTEWGRTALALLDPEASDRQSWVSDLIDAPYGADLLDYIDRDAFFCGLDHRVDSAIYRRFSASGHAAAAATSRRFAAQVYGRHGLRLDAEFALESVLRERLALFLKVYTHPAKIAAGAMVGKAVQEALGRGLTEAQLEWLADDELLYVLRDRYNGLPAKLVKGIIARKLFRPAFWCRALAASDCTEAQYDLRRNRFGELGLIDPEGRAELEKRIARESGVASEALIVYCSAKAPGIQKVRQFVEEGPGKASLRDEVHKSHRRIFSQHLALWTVAVLLQPDADTRGFNKVGAAAAEILRLENEVAVAGPQLVLF